MKLKSLQIKKTKKRRSKLKSLFDIIRYRESLAISAYKMYKNRDDDLAKLTVTELAKRKVTFDGMLPQYNEETKQNAAAMWLYSLIMKNRVAWTKDEKKNELKQMIDAAIEARLISKAQFDYSIKKEFGLDWTGGVLKPMMNNTYSLPNLFRSIIGRPLKLK